MDKIICFGDSNTYGCDPRGAFGDCYEAKDRWPDILAEKLGCETVNLGINGREIPHTQCSVDASLAVIRKYIPADLIIVMLGSNDRIQGALFDEVSMRMRSFIGCLKEAFPGTEILLVSPPDPGEYRLNAEYESIAREAGIQFCDASLWKLPMAFDGIHLTEEANHIFADEIERIL